MVPSIAALGRKCAHALIKHGVIEKLCELLVVRHMASPLKLLSLKAMDSLLDFPQGIERFLGWTEIQVKSHDDSSVLLYCGWSLHIYSLMYILLCLIDAFLPLFVQDEDELGPSCYQLVLNLILNQPVSEHL